MADAFNASFAAHVVPSPSAVLPGTVLAVGDASGTTYLEAFGSTTTASGTPLQPDDVFLIYSATKLVTAIAALQCVERGVFALDDPAVVERHLPELAAQPVLTGFGDDGAPMTAPKSACPTVRQLLMHVSGVAFDLMNPKMAQWTKYMQRPSNLMVTRGFLQSADHPLAFEPGTEFGYGAGNDWAGLLIARATQAPSLGAYMDEHIFRPLGMKDSTFEPTSIPGLVERIVPRVSRDEAGVLRDIPAAEWVPNMLHPRDHLGGTNLFSTVPDYMKLLTAVLRNDGTLLAPATMEELFRPCLEGSALASAQQFLQHTIRPVVLTSCSSATRVNYAAGGMVLLDGVEGKFGAGTLHFGGASGWCWHIDRALGKVSLIGINLWSGADEPSEEAKGEFFRFAYDRARGAAR